MPTVDRGGWALHYEVAGRGDDVLVLTHGLGTTAATWAAQREALAKRRAVVTWDLRAHGISGAPAGACTLAALADDLAAVIDAVTDRPVHVLGHSAGGVVTMQLVIDHPARVRSLVLVGTASECNVRARDWYESLAITAEHDGGTAVVKRLGTPDEIPPDPVGFARVARAMGTLHDAPQTAALRTVTCPTLIVVGEKDFLGVGGSVIISRAIEGSRLEIVPERGHPIFREDPAGFNTLVGAFLKSVK